MSEKKESKPERSRAPKQGRNAVSGFNQKLEKIKREREIQLDAKQ